MDPCPICGEQTTHFAPIGNRDAHEITCHNRCGEYTMTRTALANLQNSDLSPRQRSNISGWLCENPRYEITSTNIENLNNLKTPSFHERADKLLLSIEKLTTYAGEPVEKNVSWLSLGWCQNQEELNELIGFLKSIHRVHAQVTNQRTFVKICPEGWSHLENLKKINADSQQCFVAMWFSDEMQQIYDNIISQAILNAGYKPHRVDQREHNDKIDDEIISQIRRSRFVLADFTGHRGGVYFEAGYAKGLNLEVIWSCKEDDIENLHFDIRQYNCISWLSDNLEDFKNKLTYRVEAVLGRGSYKN